MDEALLKIDHNVKQFTAPCIFALPERSRCTKLTEKEYCHMVRMIHCVKLDKEAEGLDRPTYPGELGKRIYNHVSKEAWAMWIRHQTMLVNENRLVLADADARAYLAKQMELFFFGEAKSVDQPMGYTPPANG